MMYDACDDLLLCLVPNGGAIGDFQCLPVRQTYLEWQQSYRRRRAKQASRIMEKQNVVPKQGTEKEKKKIRKEADIWSYILGNC